MPFHQGRSLCAACGALAAALVVVGAPGARAAAAPGGPGALSHFDLARTDRQLDATLLSLLAYAGLRPESEALPLRWEDVRERVLFVPAGTQARRSGPHRALPRPAA